MGHGVAVGQGVLTGLGAAVVAAVAPGLGIAVVPVSGAAVVPGAAVVLAAGVSGTSSTLVALMAGHCRPVLSMVQSPSSSSFDMGTMV